MKNIPLNRIRNLGIAAHIDAGKTTVTERILFYTGLIHKAGEVHSGNTTTDHMVQERERGITITSAAVTTNWRDHRVNIIDTPGHVDFTVEVERSLRVLDGAIVVFDAVAGVEPQTETVWRQANRYNVPRICFVNKMDRVGADFNRCVQMISDRLKSPAPVLIQIPVFDGESFVGVADLVRNKVLTWDGDALGADFTEEEVPIGIKEQVILARTKLIEVLADHDDDIAEMYLGDEQIDSDLILKALRAVTLSMSVTPVLCGTAFKNKGVEPLLDAVVNLLPSPADVGNTKGVHPHTKKDITRAPSENDPTSALAFKLMTCQGNQKHMGQLTYFRVYSGSVKSGQKYLNVAKGKSERLGRLFIMRADKTEEVSEVTAGNIAAVPGLKTFTTGDTISDASDPILLEVIDFPDPVMGVSIEPKTQDDNQRLGIILNKMSSEDPSFQSEFDNETGQTIIKGMGELHLEILVDRMRRDHGVSVNVGKPQVAYKETVSKPSHSEYKHWQHTGGKGVYGHVVLSIDPAESGSGFEFVDKVRGGAIPREFIGAVKIGVEESMQRGVLAGYPMTDLRVTVLDGSTHDVDGCEAGFKVAGSKAFVDGAKRAGPVLLEPIMNLEITVPKNCIGDINADVNKRRGKVSKMDSYGDMGTIVALVPLAEIFGHAGDLRSLTNGRVSYTPTFSHYEIVPEHVAKGIRSFYM